MKKAAHRPLKYGEKTIVERTRVPETKLEAFRIMVRKWLKKFEVKKK